MARIVLADDGISFDGTTPLTRPLGGVESSVVGLVEELARRGHDVQVCNNCPKPLEHNGVRWTPIRDGLPETADLYIANRGDKLIPLVAKARRRVFWIHNPAQYLLKWRYLSKLWWWKPTIVFIGDYHATTYPWWGTGGKRLVIPYGIPEVFLNADPAATTPAPRAVFVSNPLRSLDWLLEIWAAKIHPQVPAAELHLYTGAATYGAVGDAKAREMIAVLDRARSHAAAGVVLRPPLAKPKLAAELRAARVMLYRGDINETFCLAVGEAQAMGIPAVVQNLGSVVERVRDGETGFVTGDDAAFAEAALRLLLDDALWRRQHEAALAKQRTWGWPEAAQKFEELIPLMRLLQAMAGAEFGGAEAFFTRLTVALQRAGLEQKVVIRRNAERAADLMRGGIEPVQLPFGGMLDIYTRFALGREIKSFKPDLVLTWMNRATVRCPEGPFVHVGRLGGYYDLKYYQKCRHLIGNTQDIVDYAVRSGWPQERVHYLPNFVSDETMPAARRDQWFTPRNAPLILAMGRLHQNKGFDVLLKALTKVPDAYLWLAGEGPLRKELEGLAERLAVKPRVRFLGWRDDTPALLAACDVFACSSRHEPLGNVVIEAWAQGVPVVATDSLGPGTLIENMKTGVLVPVDEPEQFGRALRGVIEDRAMAERLSEAGHAVFKERFTESVVVARYLEFFQRVLA